MKTTDRQGDSWEYLVLYKASRKKCEVTRNAFKQGPYDLVLHVNGKSYKCDVKADTSRYTTVEGQKTYSQNGNLCDLPKDVFMICVNPITEEISWHKKRVPTGLETFWE
tara:strand:- start:527 stop:853 length:327 start_codon:yes stop_codon:yes gene_type:complete